MRVRHTLLQEGQSLLVLLGPVSVSVLKEEGVLLFFRHKMDSFNFYRGQGTVDSEGPFFVLNITSLNIIIKS